MNRLLINNFTIPIALSLLLIILRYNFHYLVFHTFAEYFAVFVSLGITLVTYYTYSFTKNRYLLFIGLGYFWVAILDILHTQTYLGLPLYDINSSNTTLTFWVLARLLEASVLLIAPFMRNLNFNVGSVSLSFGLISFGVIALAMNSPFELFVEGEGLTSLKISFEYLIISMLLLSIYVNKRHAKEFHINISHAITLSVSLTILSELSFTMYSDMYGLMNVLGHILKFLSFWILLQAIIKTSLSEPFTLMQKGASTYNAIPIPAVVVDDSGTIREVNQAACDFLGKQESAIISESNHLLFHPINYTEDTCPICRAIYTGQKLKNYELKNEYKNQYIEYTLTPIKSAEEEIRGTLQVSINTTQKRKLQNTITNQYKLLQNIVNSMPVRVFWKDKKGIYLGANNLFLQDAKLKSSDEIIGKNDFQMVWGETDAQNYRDDDLEIMNSGEPKLQFEEAQTDENGNTTILSTSKVPLKDIYGNTVGILGVYEDITDKKSMQNKLIEQSKELEYLATHDMLTSLPNRVLFQDRLQNRIKIALRRSSKFALIFIDLDQFKQINDSLGHDVGDKVLKVLAHRLKATIREEDTLARLGGDEFTLIMNDINSTHDISTLAQKIIDSTLAPIEINENKLYITLSLGISLYPQDATNEQDLVKYADAAMYKAKDMGRNNFQYYSNEMTINAMKKVRLQTDLREAITNEDFEVYYQPQINIKEKKIIGLEALVRWRDKNNELIYPDDFIPLAEETGMIVELDRVVMKKAMKQIFIWKENGIFDGVLSLNLAIKQLERDDFSAYIKSLILECKCKPTSLELEITESGLMQKPEEAILKLNKLKEFGINIAIDDFGTGYSSFSYLQRLPISKLKIDRSFMTNVPNDKNSTSIVKAIIALSESLELDILAEGVENSEQNEFLLENGCSVIQGYFHSKPLPTDEAEKFLKNF